jgi:cell division protein FtsB
MLKQLQKHLTLNNAILFAAFLLTLSWMWGTMEALQRNYALQQEVAASQVEVELMELEAQNLEFQKRYYQSSEYLELSAREHLNKAKPGEKLLILPNHNVTDTLAKTRRQATTPPSNLQQWTTFFFAEQDNKK